MIKNTYRKEPFLLKYQLYTLNKNELTDIYLNNQNDYIEFLYNVRLLIEDDPLSLLVLKNSFNKLFDITSNYRNSKMKNKILNKKTNDTIVALNRIKNGSITDFIDRYIEEQKALRGVLNEEVIPELIAKDFCIINALEENKLDEIEYPEYVFSSSAYLMEIKPSLYKENPQFLDQTIEFLENRKKGNGFLYYLNSKLLIKQLKNKYHK